MGAADAAGGPGDDGQPEQHDVSAATSTHFTIIAEHVRIDLWSVLF